MNIENKTILITGANRGIGRALLEEALNRGAKKVYAGVRGEFHHKDSRVVALKLDVTNSAQIHAAAEQIDSLDVLINNAGIAIYDDLTSLDIIDRHMAVNFIGTFKVTTAFLPHLKRSKGAIVNNVSIVALAPLPVVAAYSISKAALLNLTQGLRAMLAHEGISVHAVMLGPVDTDMNRGFDIPKASTESTAINIFSGLQRNEDDIFPDPVSNSISEGWRSGVAKALEHQMSAFAPTTATAIAECAA